MIHDTPKFNNSQLKLDKGHPPQRGQIISLAEIDPLPDWNSYPWAGILRCMYWTYRRDLPSLAEIAQQQFKRQAERWLP